MTGRPPVDLNVYRASKQSAAKEARGNVKKAASVPVPDEVRACPSARAFWKWAVEALVARDMLDNLDLKSLTIMAGKWSRRTQYRKLIKEKGETFTTEGRYGKQEKVRPEVRLLDQIEKDLLQLFSHHGMTPLARHRLNAPEQGDLFADIDKILNG